MTDPIKRVEAPAVVVVPPSDVPRVTEPLSPTTTAEENRKSAGQRQVNIIWEATQSIIALAVTSSTLYVAAKLSILNPTQTAAFLLLSNAFFLVIGFYFGRTNHQRVGGVGGDQAGTR